MAAAFREAGALWAEQSTDEVEAEALFAVRRLAYPALERLGPVLTEDVCVPRSAVPAMLAGIEEIGRRGTAYASRPSPTPATATCTRCSSPRRATTRRGGPQQAAFDEIAGRGDRARRHGHRRARRRPAQARRDAARSWAPAVLAMQQAVKQTLDPLDLFNPGKAI